MIEIIAKHPLAFIVALVAHGLLGTLLVVSVDWTTAPTVAQPEVEVVQAIMVDEAQVQHELDKFKSFESQKQQQQTERLTRLREEIDKVKKAKETEQKRLADLEAQRKIEVEKKQRAEIDRKKAEQERKIAEAARQAAEQKRKQALEKQQQAEQDKELAEQRTKEVEKQKLLALEEMKRLEQVRLAREAKETAQQEVEQKQKERATKRKAEDEAQRRAMFEAEEQDMELAREKETQAAIARHKALIQDKIQRLWRKPATAKQGWKCTVVVQILPGGMVKMATIAQPSGDRLFDDSVLQAVYAAEPLPLPKERSLFPSFREIKFEFNPKE